MKDVIRLLLVDDHPVVREGLEAILSTQPDFNIVAQAASGPEAIALAQEYDPHVIILDLEIPEIDGIEVIECLKKSGLTARILIFTAFDTDDKIVRAIKAGAKGYLLKGAPRAELFNAIRIVHTGGSLLQPVVASRLISAYSEEPESLLVENLTSRENEVLRHVSQGKQNKEIASELSITERTVKFHISSILAKLNAGNRTEAVSIAVQNGLIDL